MDKTEANHDASHMMQPSTSQNPISHLIRSRIATPRGPTSHPHNGFKTTPTRRPPLLPPNAFKVLFNRCGAAGILALIIPSARNFLFSRI
jgi:hypothetical protein